MTGYTIGFVCPSTSWGGLEMNVHRLAVRLKRRGYRVVLYGNPLSILYQKLQSENIRVRSVISRSKFRDIFLAFVLARMVRQDEVDIVVLHLNRNFLLTTLAKIIARRPFKFVYMQHMHVGGTKKDWFHNWEYGKLDCWIAPLPGFKTILGQKIKLPPHKIEVIPLGIEVECFTDSKPDRAEARLRLNLPADVPVAGVVGRLDPKKGQHILIEACHQVRQEGHDLHVLLVGDKTASEETGYAEQLQQLTRDHELQDFVHFRPHMDDIEYAYAAMDIFTLTSKSETYGMVTLEAMASTLPVIGTAAGGTRDIIDDAHNGLLVRPYDAGHLAGAITRILTEGEFARGLARQARRDVIAKYSSHRQCDMLEGLFVRLMN
ncbi:MAG: glycosyltransferase family 4 protein [Candidatus Zixiibacteriota bacterium]|nr:MAG: glycosyltransferase family 4 protein [candidate division Zixibacteria bacterium]